MRVNTPISPRHIALRVDKETKRYEKVGALPERLHDAVALAMVVLMAMSKQCLQVLV